MMKFTVQNRVERDTGTSLLPRAVTYSPDEVKSITAKLAAYVFNATQRWLTGVSLPGAIADQFWLKGQLSGDQSVADLTKNITVYFHDGSDNYDTPSHRGVHVFRHKGRVYSRKLADAIVHIAPFAFTPFPITIEGKAGTGKRLLAKSIHECFGPSSVFISVNCAALQKNLAASVLFGRKRSKAPNGRPKEGYIEKADKGILFLNEVHGLNMVVQEQLLQFLEDSSFSRVGEMAIRYSTARIIASSSQDLSSLVAQSKFHEDLYSVLSLGHVYLPTLREQPEAIWPMFQWFVEKDCYEVIPNPTEATYTDDAKEALLNYNWPGNYCELRNSAKRIFIQSQRSDGLINGDLVTKVLKIKPLPKSANVEDSIQKALRMQRNGKPKDLSDTQPMSEQAQMDRKEAQMNLKMTGDFEMDYMQFRELIEDWKPYEERISEEAERKLALIGEHGHLPGQNLRRQLESLKDLSLIERYLIGRRVILAIATEIATRESLAEKLGFVEWKHNKEKTKIIKRTTFSTYLKVVHLVDEDFMRPYKCENLKDEELKWLEKHRPRDR
jgi:DNA-binding NtrC family response regulator